MSDIEFAAGDVVALKSGGPKMTVEQVDTLGGDPAAQCSWFDGAERCNEWFRLTAIEKLDKLAG